MRLNFTKRQDLAERDDLRRQRALERQALISEVGRIPRGHQVDGDEGVVDEADLPDAPPPGWARSGR